MRGAPGVVLAVSLAASLAWSAGASWAGESDFWAEIVDQQPTAYQKHMADGDRAASLAAERSRHGSGPGLPQLVRRAVEEYEAAARADKSAAEPHYRAAEVLYAHLINDRPYPDRTVAMRAIEHWNAFERLAPKDPRLEDALFRRSITYTKLGGDANYTKAVEDYEEELRIADESSFSSNLPVIVSNAAELYMATGRLDEAITKYKRALELRDEALYGYGLALALERDGQGAKAREVMFHYAYGDRMRSLHQNGVFFVPAGDIHAYKALGYESLGDYQRAARHYEAFLRAQPKGRYSDLARRRLEEVKKKIAEGSDAKKRPQWRWER